MQKSDGKRKEVEALCSLPRYHSENEPVSGNGGGFNGSLTAASLGSTPYAYDYDNIGNRKTAQENAEEITYTANALNQYTKIDTDGSEFIPEYDADGNQILIRTSTGIWSAEYNAQNRAIRYTRENADGTRSVITADYDYMGRRAWKKVESITPNPETGEETTTVLLHHRYIYRGYLQIATCDLTRSNHPCLWLITWDPSQQVATRPLAIQKDGTWYCYGWDLTKNICEIYSTTGYIRTVYTYTPYGEVTSSGNVTQSIQWSNEYADTELGLVYYNYRYYNPIDGRWMRRDSSLYNIMNLYAFISNRLYMMDYLGNDEIKLEYHFINVESDRNTYLSELLSTASYQTRIEKRSEFKPNDACSAEDCISYLKINAHGYFYDNIGRSTIFLAPKDGNNQNLHETISSEMKEISNFINNANIKFCKNAVLDFNVCYIGLNEEIAKRIKEYYKDINLNIITHKRIVMPGGIENWPLTGLAKIINSIWRFIHE